MGYLYWPAAGEGRPELEIARIETPRPASGPLRAQVSDGSRAPWPAISPASQAGASVAPESLVKARHEGFRAANYRTFIHQALLNPADAKQLRVAEDIENFCRLVSILESTSARAPMLSPSEQARYAHQREACKAGGGIDAQQRRALQAASERWRERPEFLIRRMKGAAEEVHTLRSIEDVAAIAEWGGLAAEANPRLFAGTESLLRDIPPHVASAAWTIAVCQRYACDELAARMVHCKDDTSCKMSLAEILEAGVVKLGLGTAQWRQIVDAAGRRVDALFPS